MAGYYPPVGFHFKVEVEGLGPNDNDVRFAEVGGLSAELVTEEVPEGGENRFVQKYPIRAKFPELVLKRGLLMQSSLLDWVRASIEQLEIAPKLVHVKLLNEEHQPLLTWNLIDAYPTKWSVSDLNASANAIVIETLQLYYKYFTLVRS